MRTALPGEMENYMLKVTDLSVHYDTIQILNKVSFSLSENKWLMIIGPNGAGKSTIIKAISNEIPYTGSVTCEGQNINKIKPTSLAKKMGVLNQTNNVSYSFTVGEVVRLGRYAYTPGILSVQTDEDEEMVHKALAATGMLPFEHHSVLKLSGGELQRTFLAQVFAQDPDILILDEPANHLDLIYQKQVFSLVKEWVKKPGRAVISVVHDLSLAKAYGDDFLLLKGGKVLSHGQAHDVLCSQSLESAYDMDVYDWMHSMLSQWPIKDSGN